jgi:hypothetical protein
LRKPKEGSLKNAFILIFPSSLLAIIALVLNVPMSKAQIDFIFLKNL